VIGPVLVPSIVEVEPPLASEPDVAAHGAAKAEPDRGGVPAPASPATLETPDAPESPGARAGAAARPVPVLDVPWVFLVEEEGIRVFKGPADDEGTLPFRATATFDVPIVRLAQVFVDAQRKPEWSPKLSAVRIFERVSLTEYVFQERYDPPWPADDRLFNVRGWVTSEGPGHIQFTAVDADDPSMDADDAITSDVHYSSLALRTTSEGTEVEFVFLGHLGGWIPDWLNNMLQRVWPRNFLLGMREQAMKSDLRPTLELKSLQAAFPWLRDP
jgi:hypothetical protein